MILNFRAVEFISNCNHLHSQQNQSVKRTIIIQCYRDKNNKNFSAEAKTFFRWHIYVIPIFFRNVSFYFQKLFSVT